MLKANLEQLLLTRGWQKLTHSKISSTKRKSIKKLFSPSILLADDNVRKKSKRDFIDVSSSSVPILKGKDAMEKAKDYVEHLKNSTIGKSSSSSFVMPTTSNNTNKVVTILNLAGMNEQELEYLKACVGSLFSSISKLNVVESGKIAESLPDIESK